MGGALLTGKYFWGCLLLLLSVFGVSSAAAIDSSGKLPGDPIGNLDPSKKYIVLDVEFFPSPEDPEYKQKMERLHKFVNGGIGNTISSKFRRENPEKSYGYVSEAVQQMFKDIVVKVVNGVSVYRDN